MILAHPLCESSLVSAWRNRPSRIRVDGPWSKEGTQGWVPCPQRRRRGARVIAVARDFRGPQKTREETRMIVGVLGSIVFCWRENVAARPTDLSATPWG